MLLALTIQLFYHFSSMQKLLLVILILISTGIIKAQDKIDLQKVKSAAQDSVSEFYFPKLVKEFSVAPEYFPLTKGKYLYYRYIYSPTYKVYDFSKNRSEFDKFFDRRNWKKSIPLGEKILLDNPIDVGMLNRMVYCYNQTNELDKAALLKGRADVLYRVILSSGEGESEESCYKIINIGEEYIIMAGKGIKGISRISKRKENSVMDIWMTKDSKSNQEKRLYFELLQNMDAMPKFK